MTDLEEINRKAENVDSHGVQNYKINMTLEYGAKSDLELEDMSPTSWWKYVKKLARSSSGPSSCKNEVFFIRQYIALQRYKYADMQTNFVPILIQCLFQRNAIGTLGSQTPPKPCIHGEFKKYYQRYTRYAQDPKHKYCDINCKKGKLCDLVTSNSKDIPTKSKECRKVEHLVDQSVTHKVSVIQIYQNHIFIN